MEFTTPLIPATLIRRYKRFLADIRLEDGCEVTAHCPNPGSMMGMAEPGTRLWVEPNEDPKKKLDYGWRLSQYPGAFVITDTSLANRIVAEALYSGRIPELAGYAEIRPEVKYGAASRVDFLLRGAVPGSSTVVATATTTNAATDAGINATPGITPGPRADCYVEVKSVTLARQPGRAEFPDSVTKRGAKHLDELAQMCTLGHRAVMLFLVARDDCQQVTLARDIDPAYAQAFAKARAAGVETLCYDTHISASEITLRAPVVFDPDLT
jgi:sugar fermentation stimulation protein A